MFILLYCLPAFARLSKHFTNSVFKGALQIEVCHLFINIPRFFGSSITCKTCWIYILICCSMITSRAVPGMLDLVGQISTQTKFNGQRVCRCSRKDDHTKLEYMCWPEARWLPVKQDSTCPRVYDWLTLFPVKPISELITLCCEGSWEVGERSHSKLFLPFPQVQRVHRSVYVWWKEDIVGFFALWSEVEMSPRSVGGETKSSPSVFTSVKQKVFAKASCDLQ